MALRGRHARMATDVSTAAESLLGRSSMVSRLILLGLTVVVAAPVLPAGLIAAWAGLLGAVFLAEDLVTARRGHVGRDMTGVAITILASVLNAAIALALVAKGDGSARFFAI